MSVGARGRARRVTLVAVTFFTFISTDLAAQDVSSAAATMICGMPVPAPAALPPAGSGPVVLVLVPCFEKQGGASVVEPQTYLYYMDVRPSLPSQDKWVPYDEAARTRC